MNAYSLGIPRHWWGKIIGAALGLIKGGVMGAVVGAFIGHMVDRFLWGLSSQAQIRRRYFRVLFACLGHVTKADGRVNEAEIAAAEALMRRLGLDASERDEAKRCFREGKSSGYRLEAELRDLERFTAFRPDLRIMFVEILLDGAAADGRITQAEQAILLRVCRALNIPAQHFSAMLYARRAGQGAGQRSAQGPSRMGLAGAYATLGLDESASDQDIKRAYRKLIGQYHPDRLSTRGMPEEMLERAKDRAREINAAYDRLKQARGIK